MFFKFLFEFILDFSLDYDCSFGYTFINFRFRIIIFDGDMLHQTIFSFLQSSDLYPIHLKKDDDRYIKLVANLRAKFCQEGIVTLPGFLRLDVIPDIAKVELNNMWNYFHFRYNQIIILYVCQQSRSSFTSFRSQKRKSVWPMKQILLTISTQIKVMRTYFLRIISATENFLHG